MQKSASPSGSAGIGGDARRRRMLNYGLVASIFGFPVGILLDMPIVWGLAIAGIGVGGIKLWLLRGRGEQKSP